ncbi:TcmI family type II polyketide cyclase [Leucobacter sp. M11]|uniref:TcmI family type II polyketide cyclase n=1 Tax=Leucobacter sp. M11 TaxID=2993565 RepID=UPI002D80804A|nr:TcmI family type II polyketide cyclase [Leucobacter sp. M11]MEB4613754.1 TcmI family type II polyketide cyclase [Leucobacter sp. M11]
MSLYTSLVVAKLNTERLSEISRLFTEFDRSDMPQKMGTVRRQLFTFHDLYFHLQDFKSDTGTERIEAAKTEPEFIQISQDLRPFFEPYDPNWQSPKDSIANRFYHWEETRD